MNIIFVGHVDHGKSTVIGRLLAETNALPKGKLEKIKSFCERNAKPFEYAFLLDALSDEQAQGITIDIARCFFKTSKRKYLILDAPGHIEFLKNFVTGATNAEAAFLIIDANEGIQENTTRHAYMLSLLGIKQIVILINKMDLMNYAQPVFDEIKSQVDSYLKKINVEPVGYIPVSGRQGDNIASLSNKTPWYLGPTTLETLDKFNMQLIDEKQPFRMHVQDVYKFTNSGDNRRIIVGQINSGTIRVGDKVIFHPTGKLSTIKTIEVFNAPPCFSARMNQSIGLTLHEQIYIKRGDVISILNQSEPMIASILKVSLFWLGKNPLKLGKIYWFKLGTSKTKVVVDRINHVLNTSSLEVIKDTTEIKANQVGECILKLFTPIAYDNVSVNIAMGRFVLVDRYDITGGGIIVDHIIDDKALLQKKLSSRNFKWLTSDISLEEREQLFNQKSKLILITGDCEAELRKKIALKLERHLFSLGKFVYFIGIGNVKHALETSDSSNLNLADENLRRFREVLNILLDTGLIIIATAAKISSEDLNLIKMTTSHDNIFTVWLSSNTNKTELSEDDILYFNISDSLDELLLKINNLLQTKQNETLYSR